MGMMETASRLIAKYGQPVTLLRPGERVPDGYGGFDIGPDIEAPAIAAVIAYAMELQAAYGGLVEIGDNRVLMSTEGLTVEPRTTDKLRIGGTVFRIIRVMPIAPDGLVRFWELQARDDE